MDFSPVSCDSRLDLAFFASVACYSLSNIAIFALVADRHFYLDLSIVAHHFDLTL